MWLYFQVFRVSYSKSLIEQGPIKLHVPMPSRRLLFDVVCIVKDLHVDYSIFKGMHLECADSQGIDVQLE